ncbi:hypothetical protein EYC84_006538 [Monilinia fructicola]|uniref:DUF4470 domain-containing protein n=1 Tax=Monilinia fructicola TaxID=38448 RepID=A0A5M9K8M3_MONFR|nr:hypothetical protein EYC84_006538 [Monilinia fructicola]
MFNFSCVPTKGALSFYPIGNTPAVNFLEYHATKSTEETTDILLLACGDPRSILYSLFCEGKPGEENFSFTCCDLEPAILARNILLFSLIIDNTASYGSQSPDDKAKVGSIWNLFYHFLVPQDVFRLAIDQSTKLLSLSETPEKWAESPYSRIYFLSLETLEEIRKVWEKYAIQRSKTDQQKYEAPMRWEISKIYREIFQEDDGGCRTYSAGIHWLKGQLRGWGAIQGYWKTGVVAGNKDDIKALGAGGKGFLNPTFAVSVISERSILDRSCDPLSSYHVAKVFDNPASKPQVLEDLAASAKKDFADWCKAFADYVAAGSVVVDFYVGDAVTLSHELASIGHIGVTSVLPRLYTKPWSAKPLLLDGPGASILPTTFEIIDTSNIVDYYGHLNILAATIPLLSRTSSSVLYTESLRVSAHETQNHLKAALLMDVNVASLLLGLTPLGHIMGYTTHNNHGEDMLQKVSPGEYRTRLPWRFPSLGDHHANFSSTETIKIGIEATELSKLCFDLYLKMFSIENPKNDNSLGTQPLLSHQICNCYSRLNTSGFMPGALSRAYGAASYSYVTLVVPRRDLNILFQPYSPSQPGIHISIFNLEDNNENLFFSIDGFFGTLGPQTNPDLCGEFTEDPAGWMGTSDLCLSCPVPSHILQGKWHIGLCITNDRIGRNYFGTLGSKMMLSAAPGKNAERVTISKVPPNISIGRLQQIPAMEKLSIENEFTKTAISIRATIINESVSLQATYCFSVGTEETKALQKAAFVTLSDVTPCSILLNIGEFSHRLVFPYPIDGAKATTKIARKSLWIQVNVPVAPALKNGGYDSNPFPIVTSQNQQPAVWALPRINLATLSRVNSNRKEWLRFINYQICSDREMRKPCTETVSTESFPIYYVAPSEHILWKRIMPSAVESCRRNWNHKASCEYRKAQAPLSTEPWASPICKCGEGKDVEEFPKGKLMKLFQDWSTRIALPLLSAVSYVEAMGPPGPPQIFSP